MTIKKKSPRNRMVAAEEPISEDQTLEEQVSEQKAPIELCGAWAFILGASLGAFCRMTLGHEGDHQTEIKVYAEPRSRFTIMWALEE